MSLVSLESELKAPVLIALVLGLALRVAFLLATPFNEAEKIGELSAYNDESAHVGYTRHVVNTHTLPRVITPITSGTRGDLPTFENYQSPLGYIIHALACKAFKVKSATDIASLGRWLSLFYMALAIFIATVIAKDLGRLVSSDTPALFLIFLALSGVFVRFSTLSGNDMLAWLAIGWATLAYVNHERYASSHNFHWLIIAFILGVYVKLTTLLIAPLIALSIIRTYKSDRSRAIIGTLYVIGACAPLAAYNLQTFGSILPLSRGFGETAWRIPDMNTVSYVVRSSVFPWSELWRNWLGLAFLAPAMIGLGWIALGILRNMRKATWAFLIFFVSLAAFAWLNLRYDQAEGRYLFAAWPAVIIGIEALPPKLRSPWLWLAILLLPYLLFVI